MSAETTIAPRPDHVPAELVRDFNFYDIPGSAEDVQAAYAAVQVANPDIFWTPHNGGHGVATRGTDILAMQRDYRHLPISILSCRRCPKARRARFRWKWTRPNMLATAGR